ncbi:MAG TPA: hypothetical protein VLF89_09515 [Candidatus Saccharimonadales bacterium]|nr:hypothetical protein [Candidatus Saccharimonadales bacterium]
MENKRNNFFDGLLLGAVLGGAVVFLLGTKKGREVLKLVKEEGQDRFGKFEDMFHEYHESMREEVDDITEEIKSATHKETAKSPARRKLFKGLSKRK